MARFNEDQLQQVRDERREQIMSAALKVFARSGINGTKMSMIAAEAGISKGLLYLYFTSKNELFIKLVQEAMEGAVIAMEQISSLPGSPLEKIRALTTMIFSESDKDYFRLIQYTDTSDEVPEEAKALLQQHSTASFFDVLMPIFVEGQQVGELLEGDPGQLIASYLTVLHALMLIDVGKNTYYRIPEVDVLLRIITNGPIADTPALLK
ncbi:TetR/AcrR family transcriptional regulator [Paenibacillus sp. 481]|uniref:TetR/AcrR family transcriptional regulator n=1 Tax=Paenibacillus sp. 481 TaxID=2835869 RepID=UPI001E43AD58|nr:TetR/AcrR family transcriptional regulator [Paenibacillus sp. 481]UHA75432.1 TetR/AcrR family transcriptional regulator [Paenibacillus sp. 481]